MSNVNGTRAKALAAAGGRLLDGKTPEGAAEDAVAWIRRATATTPFDRAMPVVEHLWGVIPLLDRFEGDKRGAKVLKALRGGEALGCLGMFTPNPEFSFAAARVAATVEKTGALRLRGEARGAGAAPEWMLVAAQCDDGSDRLALVSSEGGAVRSAARGGAREARGAWWHMDGTLVERDLVSDPLSGTDAVSPVLDTYAAMYALAAASYAKRGVLALRAAARKTTHGRTPFNTSQVVAMGTTEIEIQVHLLMLAVTSHLGSGRAADGTGSVVFGGLLLAATAARLLSLVKGKIDELTGEAGLTCSGPLAGGAGALSGILFGGRLMLESEVARYLGL